MVILDKGGSIGQVNNIECPAWILCDDLQRYDYNRESIKDSEGGTPINQLSLDEQLLAPGVIYKLADKRTKPPCCAGECEFCI